MFYDVLRTWLIAKEIIQRSAKAMRENIGPPWTAEIRCCFIALFLRSQRFFTNSLKWMMGWPEKLPNQQGLAKESHQGLGPEHNL